MANNNQQIPIGIVAPAVKGDWLSAMTYNVLNIVRHNNATYMSKVKNVGIEPGASTSWENTWALLVQDGNGIVSIEQTGVSEDTLTVTYTILFTDGSSTTFEVKNGNGIKSVEKIGTEGLVDTYAILFTDGTSTTFLITNGKNGETGNGISSITLASTQGLVKTYDINFTNGTKTQFSVSDGEKGETGNGISNIELTSTNGLEKTYTIYFTDGNTTTFVVTDGEGVPAGGDEGDVLVKNSSTNYDCVWVPQSQLSVKNARNDQYGNNIANSYANALKGTVSGIGVALTDVSPIEHELGVKVESKNLIPYPYYQKAGTVNGITFTDNGDGSLTLNGTANVGIVFALYFGNMSLKGKYTLSGVTNGGTVTHYLQPIVDGVYFPAVKTAPMTYDINGNLTHIMLSVNSGATLDNVVVKPQLEAGTIATDYALYIKPSAVTVARYGKNLVNIPNITSGLTADSNGITIDCYIPYTVTISGVRDNVLVQDDSGNTKNIWRIQAVRKNGDIHTLMDNTEPWAITVTATSENPIVQIKYRSYYIVQGQYKDIQVELGDVATEYVPYVEPTTYTPTEGGAVDGVFSVYPTTTLVTDNAGAVISAEYNRDINKAFEELYNAIISLGGNV